MNRVSCIVFAVGFALLFESCKTSSEDKENEISMDSVLKERYSFLLEYKEDSLSFPRSYKKSTQTINKVTSKDWTSGFFTGNLWQLYELTKDEAYKEKARAWTNFIEREKFNDETHDMGFKVFCSFGNGLKHINDKDHYKNVIVESAKTLVTRYNNSIESLRSWDFNKEVWQFPVIIDNMMNLELLFEATKISGDSTFHNIAVNHANTTLKNHFRKDDSSWHVVDYDTITAKARMKVTHQGFNDDSAWSRGQAWAIYGFTMAYRYTEDKNYLKQAEATASYYLNHPDLPNDGIPYWDFNDPEIPKSARDVSASTIIASAFVELFDITKNENYINYSKKVINTLQDKDKDYVLDIALDVPFILDHSTGNWPKNDEISEPIVYADYYYLETLLRLKYL